MTLKIIVAGGTGMVGGAIIRKLISSGYKDIVSNFHNKKNLNDNIQWEQLDLTNQHAVAEFFLIHKPDVVFLAAAKVGGILANSSYPANFIYENLMIQANVLHQSYSNSVQRLLFLGSSCVYPKHAPQPMIEEHLMTGPLESTNSSYAVAKIAGIEMCAAYNKQYETSFLPVMPTNLYGPHDNFDLETSHVLPALIRKFHLAKLAQQGDYKAIEKDERIYGPIPQDILLDLGLADSYESSVNKDKTPLVRLWGSGTPLREFLHVDDLAEACVFTLLNTKETQLLNIGVGSDLSIKELAIKIQEIVGFEGEVLFDTEKPDGTPRKLLDISKLETINWKPKISLQEGISSTYDWYLDNKNYKD